MQSVFGTELHNPLRIIENLISANQKLDFNACIVMWREIVRKYLCV